MKMFVIFSHKLTQSQIEDAKTNLKVDSFLYLPKELQKLWSNIDVNEDINRFLLPIKEFILKNYEDGDVILIQGEFGATYNLVTFCKERGFKAVYATTLRDSKEVIKGDKVEKISYFSHISYEEYQENDLH